MARRRKKKPWLHETTKRNFAFAHFNLELLKMFSVYENNKNETSEKITRYGCVFILLVSIGFIIFVKMNAFTWIIFAIILAFLVILWITSVIASAYIAQATPKYDVSNSHNRSRAISATVKREVWRRDQGRCVQCGSNENLEFDHIIPFSKGGSNTARNIQLLCEKCNRSKGAEI